MSKRGLGKGLNALFASNVETVETAADEAEQQPAQELSVKDLIPNPFQPRKTFDPDKLAELIASIKEHGIIQPLIVRQKGSKYEIVAGERRWRAAKAAKLKTVPTLVRAYEDEQMMELALIENIQRHDLNAIEEAEGIKNLMLACNYTQEQAAVKVGRSRTAVANLLRLLHLPEKIRNDVARETLTMGQVKPLLSLASEAEQLALGEAISAEDWSARLVERIVREMKNGATLTAARAKLLGVPAPVPAPVAPEKAAEEKEKKPAPVPDTHLKVFEDSLIAFLGTKVSVVPKNKKQGRIVIDYYSQEDLERIYDLLQNMGPNTAGSIGKTVKGKFTV